MATEEHELPNKESKPVGRGEEEEMTDHRLFMQRRCCCCLPIFSSTRSRTTVGLTSWERVRTAEAGEDRWWSRGVRALMKFREWSEIVAGPRWKTFIRRFNRNRSFGGGSSGGGGGSRHHHHGKFQYDPLSYSLNFDEGHGQNGHFDDDGDDYGGLRDFSSRYASVSVSVRD